MKGYNGTIFAYGQTGSGKTFTMVGDFNNKSKGGIIPRSINYIYKEMNKIINEEGNPNNSKFSLYLSFIQIYLESIQDLLEPESKEIKIREDPEKGVYLEGVQWVRCSSPDECAEIFHMGEKNRATESTRMNAHSSRSHAILILRIERSIKVTTKTKVKNIKQASDRIITCSHLYLVDLAGSERVKKTGATNMRLEEAKKINASLLALGNVISALSDPKSTHISYRDSKLTRLLQESLGGNAKTSLIVTVSPSTYNTEETISSLFFALRAMKVQNKPKINKTVDYQALCVKLQEDLDKLNDEYGKLKIEYEKVVTELDKIKKGEKYLEIKKTMNEIEGEIDRVASNTLFDYVKKQFSASAMNANHILNQNSKMIWQRNAADIRARVTSIILEAPNLVNDKKNELLGLIATYQDIPFEDEADSIFYKKDFDKYLFVLGDLKIGEANKLNLTKLGMIYNRKLKELVENTYTKISASHKASFVKWCAVLFESISNHIQELNPTLRDLVENIKIDTEKITDLEGRQERLSEYISQIENLMAWKIRG